ncbi:uncharacterized protein LOC126682222 [Mercurialis annua]|uniref:uncharacterized protein LOC126682222 n=1 Tax=Mercurialis annua TaxID=3986 RepID=UPI00215F6491|nr:uncharacterized protein LOC126682222 [Mercurialis annua]
MLGTVNHYLTGFRLPSSYNATQNGVSHSWEEIGVGARMASSAPTASQNPKKTVGFIANAIKHKHSFIQFFAMTGILLLSVRSLGQKYRLHDLEEDTSALKEEQKTLTTRLNNIRQGLLNEASLDSTGRFASRLRLLFGDEN